MTLNFLGKVHFAKKKFSDDDGLDSALSIPPLLQQSDFHPGATTGHEVAAELEGMARGDLHPGSVAFFRAIKNTVEISEVDKRKKTLESACMKWLTFLE